MFFLSVCLSLSLKLGNTPALPLVDCISRLNLC